MGHELSWSTCGGGGGGTGGLGGFGGVVGPALLQALLFLPMMLYGGHSVPDRLGNQLVVRLAQEAEHDLPEETRWRRWRDW